jgi:hypothetical protein
MKLVDEGGTLVLKCDVCQVPLRGEGTVGLHGGEILAVHHHCRDVYQQFFLNTIDRELSVSAFLAEVAAL